MAQNHQVMAKECSAQLDSVICVKNDDCGPPCLEAYKDQLYFAACLQKTPDLRYICVCSYYC